MHIWSTDRYRSTFFDSTSMEIVTIYCSTRAKWRSQNYTEAELKWSNAFCLAACASALMKNPITPISAPINTLSIWEWDTSGLQRWDNISSTYNPILMLLALWTWTNTLSFTHLTHYEVSAFTHTTHLLPVAPGRMVLAEWRWAEEKFQWNVWIFFPSLIVLKLETSLCLLK